LVSECAKQRPNIAWTACRVETAVPAEWTELFTPQNLIQTQGGAAFVGTFDVTGDLVGRDKIVNVIVQGFGDLPIRYDGAVRNFLNYYVGTNVKPTPFGGRATDLKCLDKWLFDIHAPHYAFLAAPAGRGKSALLAHWVVELQKRDDLHIVFFPISIRYGTNRDDVVFSSLAARMAHVHGERVDRAYAVQEYRSVFNDYAVRLPKDGKQVLIVLDALDEAAGWEAGADLFPDPAPAHLRVLVSARTRAGDPDSMKWLTQLGWERGRAHLISLGALDVSGVHEVLARMGNPLDALAPHYNIVAKLYELSKGDPLMVRLYIEALLPLRGRAATLTLEDLLHLKPGLKAFFDRWFDEQKKLWKGENVQETVSRDRAVNGLLSACAVAKGPLSREDVLSLCVQTQTPEINSSADLEWAAERVNRFIIGDGREHYGYVFSHPRLGQHFADRMAKREYEDWRERFLHYGRETLAQLNAGRLKPMEVTPYVVHYYGAHLSESQAEPQAFYDLMSEGWLRAWERLDGTPEGFLNDCNRACAAAKREGKVAIGQQVRVALCHSSVRTVSTNTDVQLLVACVRSGVVALPVARVMARLKLDLQERFEVLVRLSELTDEPELLLIEALAAARAIGDERYRTHALNAVAERLPPEQQPAVLAEALTAARAISDHKSRAYELRTVAERLPHEQQPAVLAEALTAARAIGDEGSRAYALSAVAERLPPEQQPTVLAEALVAARAIGREDSRNYALSMIAECLPPEQPPVLAEAMAAAHEIGNEEYRARLLGAIATRVLPKQRSAVLAEVLAAARAIRNERDRTKVLRDISENLPSEQILLQEMLQALTVERRETMLRILGRLIWVFRDLGGERAMRDVARAIIDTAKWWP
jgi:hypothetical protein